MNPLGGKPGLMTLFEQMHKRSKYARHAVDVKYLREFLISHIVFNAKKPMIGAVRVFVADVDGAIVGFVIAGAERLYNIGVDLMVSDIFFYVSAGGPASAAEKLWSAVEEWSAVPYVAFVRPTVTDAISDWTRTASFFKRRGYKQIGGMFESPVRTTRSVA